MNDSRLRDAIPRLDRRVQPSPCMPSSDEYLDGIVRALERNARTTSARLDRALRLSAPKKRLVDVFAISDVHYDHGGAKEWAASLSKTAYRDVR